jgi:hypothetical protein
MAAFTGKVHGINPAPFRQAMCRTGNRYDDGKRGLILGVAFTIAFFSATASAQTPDAPASSLELGLKDGERVIVTGRVSCRDALSLPPATPPAERPATCTVGGKATLQADRLVVVDRVSYTFPLDIIERVERPRDRIWNGAAIGYAAGFVPLAVMEIDCRRSPGCWEGLGLAIGMVITGPIGFGIGALTDALIHRPRLVYSRTEGHPTVSVTPIVTPHTRGVGVAVAF